jgi:hypothetical protein
MTKATKRIKVNSLEFGKQPFRKLGDLKIEFADRLTPILLVTLVSGGRNRRRGRC